MAAEEMAEYGIPPCPVDAPIHSQRRETISEDAAAVGTFSWAGVAIADSDSEIGNEKMTVINSTYADRN